MQAEYFDNPGRTDAELRRHYAALNRINRLIRFERPFRLWLPALLGKEACRRMTALDLGAGDGFLGRELTAWAGTQGWEWEFTNLDLCPVAADLDPGPRHHVASALKLPFADGSFDVVLATTMTHHLASDDDVIAHFAEASRVARRLVLICDLHRNPVFLAVLWALVWMAGESREFRHDAALSVRRGWRTGEWRRLSREAGMKNARVWFEHGTRVILAETKG